MSKSPASHYVLVVDDNPFVAHALGKLLQRDGYKVKIAYDGESALAITRHFDLDAVILDIDLPGKNGYEIAQTLKKELTPRTPLIALTGYGRTEDKERAKEAGFDHHLTKPILVKEVEVLFKDPDKE